MNAKPFIVRPGDRSPALNVIGIDITVLASQVDTLDRQITLQAGPEGAGPPPHQHDWDESFYVIRGEVRFTAGAQAATCSAGTLVHVPAGTVHAFSFGPGGAEMLEITGGRSKAVRLFAALDREIPPGPPDVAQVVRVASNYGVQFQL